MGKLKRPRQKYHFSKTKSPKGETPLDTPLSAESNLPLALPSGNIFSGVKITLEHLKQKLPDDDVASVVSSRKSKLDNSSRPTTKKEKIKSRKEAFLRKLNIAHNLKSETRERKKRQKTSVIGDMRPLLDALPPVSCKEKTQTFQSKIKKSSVFRMKQRRETQEQGECSQNEICGEIHMDRVSGVWALKEGGLIGNPTGQWEINVLRWSGPVERMIVARVTKKIYEGRVCGSKG
uniref:Uncharacterized protein n=1 Tax=Timema douglasi TaxID=61478 RepID=A0A7R8ZCZ6_TIMDO|nr:unnamed protein product [Timema douglasi]